jgi:hypothetical protein
MKRARLLSALLVCAATLRASRGAFAAVDITVTGDLVHAAPGSAVLMTATITNLGTSVVCLNGITSAVPATFAQDDAFDAFTSLRPDSLGPGEAWEGPVLQLRVAPTAAIGVSVFDLSLTGGPQPYAAGVVGTTYFAVEDSSGITGVVDGAATVAALRASPNPFTREAGIDFSAPSPGDYDIAVFDIIGRHVATLHSGPLTAGVHHMSWDGRSDGRAVATSGVFFIRASSGDRVLKTKVLKLQ